MVDRAVWGRRGTPLPPGNLTGMRGFMNYRILMLVGNQVGQNLLPNALWDKRGGDAIFSFWGH